MSSSEKSAREKDTANNNTIQEVTDHNGNGNCKEEKNAAGNGLISADFESGSVDYGLGLADSVIDFSHDEETLEILRLVKCV